MSAASASADAPANEVLAVINVDTAAEPNDTLDAEAIVKHNTKKGLNGATKAKLKNKHLFHILLVRHAESENNVLAEQITEEFGMNPYGPKSSEEIMAIYDKRRVADPALSTLGKKQADLLPLHPHLKDIDLERLVSEQRVRFVTSPMQRTILTSLPLYTKLKAANPSLPRATVVPDLCEKGGNYISVRDTEKGVSVNKVECGATRAELEERWGKTHDPALCREDGWWHTGGSGAEEDKDYSERLERAEQYLMEQVHAYAQDSSKPDYLFTVLHADIIDSLLCKILRLQAGHAKYVFYSTNTAISHLEFEVHPPPTADGEKQRDPAVRVRGTNIKPIHADSHELSISRNTQ